MNAKISLKRTLFRMVCRILSRIERTSGEARSSLENLSWGSEADQLILQRNHELREVHRGKPGFVIGNGPSLNLQDLKPLRSEITFAMSGFWKHHIVEEWQPTYYCFADPLFFDRSEGMKRFFAGLNDRVKCTKFLVPLAGHGAVVEQNLLKGAPAFYVDFQGGLERSAARRLHFEHAAPAVQSVSQFAIMAAIYMGCSPIYLIGLDHDWLAKRGEDRHFYAGKTVEGHAVAHGDLDRVPYRADLVSVLRLWDGYERLKGIAAIHGCEILNATRGGFLDVFPRISYEGIFSKQTDSEKT